jgi:hypothetical protein
VPDDNDYYGICHSLFKNKINIEFKVGFRSRSREPAIKIDGSEILRHPVDILLLELMKAYIFLITLGTLLKSLFTNLLYFKLWEPGAENLILSF